MISVYAGVGNGTNLVAPFYVAACWTDPNWVNPIAIKSHSYPVCLSSLRQLNRIHSKQPVFQVQLKEISLFEIEYWGIDLATQRALKEALFYLDCRLGCLGLDSSPIQASVYSPFKLERNKRPNVVQATDLNSASMQISRLYTEAFRAKQLADYHRQFPQLKLSRHKGYPTDGHIDRLLKVSLLPPFYIRELAFKSGLNRILKTNSIDRQPRWFQNYLRSITNEGLIDIRNVGTSPLFEAEGDFI